MPDPSVPVTAGTGPADPRRYIQIAADVRHLITSGRLGAGDCPPSVSQLADQHAAARQTCGRALQLLTDEGLLARWPGVGYRVTATPQPLRPTDPA